MNLERRYARLLRAYPEGRRAEILGTLIEAAPAGRDGPTVIEAVDLVRHGLRARLGRPASRGVVVMATLVALVAGFAGAAVLTRVAWEFAPAYPSGAALHELNETLFPGLGSTTTRAGHGLFNDITERSWGELLANGHDEDFEFSTLWFGPDGRYTGEFHPYLDGVRDRLIAAGWRVSGYVESDDAYEGGFTATRDGRVLSVSAIVDSVRGYRYDLSAGLDRLTPWWITVLTFAGLLLGALGGWLVTGWVSRRTERAGWVVRSLTREPVTIALVLLVPQALIGFLELGIELGRPGDPPGVAFWSVSLTYFYHLLQLAVVLLLVPLVVALANGREPAAAAEVAR